MLRNGIVINKGLECYLIMNSIKQEKIWEHFQNSELNVFAGAHPRLAFLANQVPKGSRVLNVGIGDGFF